MQLVERFVEKVADGAIPNLSVGSDPLFLNLTIKANVILNILSIIGGLLVIVLTLLLWLYDRNFVNRVSIRLNLAISVIDIIKAAIIYSYTFADGAGWWCGFSVFLINFLTNLYLVMSSMIAYNLQHVILMEKQLRPWMERWIYFFGSFVIALAFSLPPYIAGRFGSDEATASCWYVDSWTYTSRVWIWAATIIPNIITILYCNVVVGVVVAKIIRENKALLSRTTISTGMETHTPNHISSLQRRTQLAINRVVTRILLYPIIPFVTQTLFIASEIYTQVHNEINLPLSLAGNIGTDLPGILNCVAFLLDPAFLNSVSRIRQDIIDRYAYRPAVTGSDSFIKSCVWTFLRPKEKKWQSHTMSQTNTSTPDKWSKLNENEENSGLQAFGASMTQKDDMGFPMHELHNYNYFPDPAENSRNTRRREREEDPERGRNQYGESMGSRKIIAQL
ncbi:uncharacterized protein VTP21DRAFT_4968 [Calcarisporiella thermophila]|uniref:uncharacterized protein n=1 Tax=Calcarisporiella thermophila TaxID=911321 RepID=UPI003743A7EA